MMTSLPGVNSHLRDKPIKQRTLSTTPGAMKSRKSYQDPQNRSVDESSIKTDVSFNTHVDNIVFRLLTLRKLRYDFGVKRATMANERRAVARKMSHFLEKCDALMGVIEVISDALPESSQKLIATCLKDLHSAQSAFDTTEAEYSHLENALASEESSIVNQEVLFYESLTDVRAQQSRQVLNDSASYSSRTNSKLLIEDLASSLSTASYERQFGTSINVGDRPLAK